MVESTATDQPSLPSASARTRDQQSVQDPVPGAVAGPGAVALPDGLPGTELGGQIAPGDPAPVPVDDASTICR